MKILIIQWMYLFVYDMPTFKILFFFFAKPSSGQCWMQHITQKLFSNEKIRHKKKKNENIYHSIFLNSIQFQTGVT